MPDTNTDPVDEEPQNYDRRPHTRIFGLGNDDRVSEALQVELAHTIDERAAFDHDDLVSVSTEFAASVGLDSDTPLRIRNPVVQFGDARDAELMNNVETSSARSNAHSTLPIGNVTGDTAALRDDGITHVVIHDLVYDVDIATPRAEGRINECLSENILELWDPDPEGRTELQPARDTRTDSRQVTRDSDDDPCPVCGSKWTDRRYTYRPRSLHVSCAVCGHTYERVMP